MPVTEIQVGITETLGPHSPFRAVLKQRVDDFIVQEVLKSGEIARINCLPFLPAKRPLSPTPKAETGVALADEQFVALDALFPDLNPPHQASEAVQALLKEPSKSSLAVFPICKDKDVRGKIHAWVRENLPGFASETVVTEQGPIIHVRLESAIPSNKRRRNNSGKLSYARIATSPNSVPEVVDIPRKARIQFKLWKRDCETNIAIQKLGKILHLPPAAFSYAGTKDKRGITTQLLQVRNVNPINFAHVNRAFGPTDRLKRSIAVGDIEVSKRNSLSLGDLRGNRFTIALRDLDISCAAKDQNVRLAVESLKLRGFINYFGMQRFGSGVSPTHETGFAVLREDFEDVCRRLLLPLHIDGENENGAKIRPDRHAMTSALESFADRKISAKQLLEKLPSRMFVECTIASSFVHDETRDQGKYDYRAAFNKLPRNLRSMYGHAVQSYLWNVMASHRIRAHCPNSDERMHAIAGDIILKNNDENTDVNSSTEIHTVTEEEEENRSVSVFQVVLPVVGSDVAVPKASWGLSIQDILVKENVDLQSRLASELNLKGTYRYLLAKPQNVEYSVVDYMDGREKLIPDGLDHLTFQDGTFKNDVETSSARGTEPSHVEQTGDSMIGHNGEMKLDPNSMEHTVSSKSAGHDKEHVVDTSGAHDKHPDTKRRNALILSFTLGCAEYATMLFRELTKQESTTANQKAMQNLADSDEKTSVTTE